MNQVDRAQGRSHEVPDLLAERFEVLRLLGQGNFGETFAARDRQGGAQVAVKVLRVDRLEDWKAFELFEREARVLARLDHPRIPDYVDYVHDESTGRAYLVQQLAPGRPVGELLKEGRRFKQEEALKLARQILDVLLYLSSLRPSVIHRDIKPDNLLLHEDQIYVVDFGAVQEVARMLGHSSTVAGTFGYMAPEQLRGQASPASDIFALGMTLIHMVTGRAPETIEERRMRPDFRPYADLSPAFAHVLDEMIATDRKERVDSPERCLQMLEKIGGVDRVELSRRVAAQGDQPRTDAWIRAREKIVQQKRDQKQAFELARLKKARWREEIRDSSGGGVEIVATGDNAYQLHIQTTLRRSWAAARDNGFWAGFATRALIFPLFMFLISPIVYWYSHELADELETSFFLMLLAATGICGLFSLPTIIFHSYEELLKSLSRSIAVDVQERTVAAGQYGLGGRSIYCPMEYLVVRTQMPEEGKLFGKVSLKDKRSGSFIEMTHLAPKEVERLADFFEDRSHCSVTR